MKIISDKDSKTLGLILESLQTKTHEHELIECPEHEGGYDCTPFCRTCEGNQEYCKLCNNDGENADFNDDGTITHCGQPVEWVLHEHGDVLNDPCYAWVCSKGDVASDYDCGEE